MGYVKLADVVDLEEIREALEYDAKPRFNLCKGEEDATEKFWEAIFGAKMVHPEIEDDESEEEIDEPF